MKKIALISMVALLTACSSMKEIEERKTYAEPSWYQDCAQSGTEGWFWNTKEYAYACGAGDSAYGQAAEEQMYAIALNNFAKRINGTVNSETIINITDNRKTTRTVVSYKVENTSITNHLEREKGHFTMNGTHYTFIKLKMPKADFDRLLAEAKTQRMAKQ